MNPSIPPDAVLLSATQVDLYTDCHRKWGFKYLERIELPKDPGALLGTEVQDEQIDPYLGTGRGFDFSRPSGEIAQKLVPLLPAPMTPGLILRRKFLMPSPSGRFAWRGEFDLYAPDSAVVPGLVEAGLGGVPLLGDIKTTKDLKYAKTKEQLLTDTQAQLYGMAVMFEENADVLDAVWFYTRTRGARRAERHHVRLVASHVAEQFGRLDAIGVEVAATKLARPKVEDLKPNARMCDAYGGCPYRSRCNLSPAVHAAAVNDEERRNMDAAKVDFLANLRKPVAGVVGTVSVTVPLVPQTMPIQRMTLPAPTESLPSWATATVDPLRIKTFGSGGVTAPAINPPESALPPAPAVGVAARATAPEKRTRRTKAEMEAGANGPVTVAEATQVGPVPSGAAWLGIAEQMKQAGVKRLAFMSGQVHEIELFKTGSTD
jgi:hypothetical protein